MLPYRIYLSGGGMATTAHIGALTELTKYVPITMVKEWMGVSAGAFISMALMIGYTLNELEDFCLRFDFNQMSEMDSVPGWLLHFGMDTGDRLYKMIAAFMHAKELSEAITFKEAFDQFGVSLRIIATDLNHCKPIVFHNETTPNYRIVDAVRASMSVPYYYQPFICSETNHLLVDGACISNYPMYLLSKEEQMRTLSILIRTSLEPKDTMEWNDFLLRPLNVLYIHKMEIESCIYDCQCIQVMLGQIDIMNFSLEMKVKEEMIEKGKDAVKAYYKKPCITRRKSF